MTVASFAGTKGIAADAKAATKPGSSLSRGPNAPALPSLLMALEAARASRPQPSVASLGMPSELLETLGSLEPVEARRVAQVMRLGGWSEPELQMLELK